MHRPARQIIYYKVEGCEPSLDFTAKKISIAASQVRGVKKRWNTPIILPDLVHKMTMNASPFKHKRAKDSLQVITFRRLIGIETESVEIGTRFSKYVTKILPSGVSVKVAVQNFESLDLYFTVPSKYLPPHKPKQPHVPTFQEIERTELQQGLDKVLSKIPDIKAREELRKWGEEMMKKPHSELRPESFHELDFLGDDSVVEEYFGHDPVAEFEEFAGTEVTQLLREDVSDDKMLYLADDEIESIPFWNPDPVSRIETQLKKRQASSNNNNNEE